MSRQELQLEQKSAGLQEGVFSVLIREQTGGRLTSVCLFDPQLPSLAEMAHLTELFKYVDEHQDLYVEVRASTKVFSFAEAREPCKSFT